MWFIFFFLYCYSVILAQLVEEHLFPLNYSVNFLQNRFSFPLIYMTMLNVIEWPFNCYSFIMGLRKYNSSYFVSLFQNGVGFSMMDPDFPFLSVPSNFLLDTGYCDCYLVEYRILLSS